MPAQAAACLTHIDNAALDFPPRVYSPKSKRPLLRLVSCLSGVHTIALDGAYSAVVYNLVDDEGACHRSVTNWGCLPRCWPAAVRYTACLEHVGFCYAAVTPATMQLLLLLLPPPELACWRPCCPY